jgi:hypothetical protein
MNRNALSVLTVAMAALLLIGAGHDGGGEGGHSGGGKVYRRRKVSVPKASMPAHGGPSDHGRAVYPEHNEAGGAITQHAAQVPPSHHAEVERNPGFVRNIQSQQRSEVVPNHYYWHNAGGLRYSHYYDGHNHWYGFYHGPSFYWTRYYGNRWWWFDGPHARWVFWWNGFWWWPGVNGVPYVYVDNNYYPYETTGVTVEHAEPQPAPPTAIPAPGSGKQPVSSPDGSRMVQMGADGQAFLYDKTKTPPSFMKYLGQGVTKARFSGGTAGAPLQILVEYKDNTFALFDGDGNSQSSSVESTEAATPAPPENPDSIPPPPTSAPGQ